MITLEALSAVKETPLILEKSPVVTFGYLVQVSLSLAIVLGLIYLTSKYLLPKLQANLTSKMISVKDRLTLEPQVSIYIVKVGSKNYVLASSNKTVTLLDTLKEDIS